MDRDAVIADIKKIIVSSLELEDLRPEDIATDEALFGEGLALDSIDALELGMAIRKRFGVVFPKNNEENKKIFASTAALADFIIASKKV